MPRSSRSSGGRSAPAPSGSRGAHTMASRPSQPPANAPQHNQHPQQMPQQYQQQVPMQQQKQPGMFSQMASTAAGVAVGSSVGHAVSSMFFGGRGSEPAAEAQAPPPQNYEQTSGFAGQNGQQAAGASCEAQSKDFIKCLESTNDMNSCSYYLEALKACQAAARPY